MPSDLYDKDEKQPELSGEKKKYNRNNATWHLKKEGPHLLWIPRRDLLPPEFYSLGKKKEGLVPRHPHWRVPCFIIIHSLPPLFFQMMWYYLFPSIRWHSLFFWAYLFVSHIFYLIRLLRNIKYWIKFYGVLDHENSPRDIPRDSEAFRLGVDIIVYNFVRTAGVVFLGGYDSSVPPTFGLSSASITPFLLLKMPFWFLSLDLFFYFYHRACHEIPLFWKIHSKHHGTRHPTPLQAILAGDIQEIIEIATIPFLATCIVPMNSYELYIVMCTLVYVEALGHSGARAYWGHPILNPILDRFGLALTIEDHDLHHRNGKSGKCYGKQSLVWDRLFGTVGQRIECTNDKVAPY